MRAPSSLVVLVNRTAPAVLSDDPDVRRRTAALSASPTTGAGRVTPAG